MSVVHERSALEPPVSLFDHARRLHQLRPGDPLPDGGNPLPDSGDNPPRPYDGLSEQRQEALRALLQDFIADQALSAQDLHDRCTQLEFHDSDVRTVLRHAKPEPSPRLIRAARRLVRTGTDRRAVLVGLGLLQGNADQHDIPVVKVLGLLTFAAVQAVRVLLTIPGAEQDVFWLVDRSPSIRGEALAALIARPDPVVREWVRSTPGKLLSTKHARKIAETHGLRDLLEQPDVADVLWDQAGNLLFAMSNTLYYASLGQYQDAMAVCRRWVALAEDRSATVGRAVLLISVAEELATGYAALVAGDLRSSLVAQINSVLAAWTDHLEQAARGSDPVEARRAAWVIRQAAALGVPDTRFAVRVVPHEPNPVSIPVEARIVIDGRPIVAAVFRGGWSDPPEQLIHGGTLRATSEPKEILLDENFGSELYVTIVREGHEVVWKDWRCDIRAELPGEIRFDAGEYDREVTRAEQDHSWEWPARTVARLVNDRLSADPAILGRWNCGDGHCRNSLDEFGRAVLHFRYPPDRNSIEDPSVAFQLVIEVGDRAPKTVADEVIASLLDNDAKDIATMRPSSKDDAEKLGLSQRPPP